MEPQAQVHPTQEPKEKAIGIKQNSKTPSKQRLLICPFWLYQCLIIFSMLIMREFGPGALDDRPQSAEEEMANSVSHGLGLIAAVVASPFLIWVAANKGDALTVVGVSVFAISMILVYLSSVVYHSLPKNRAKRVFLIIDHIAIFLLIAGTYTPFALGVLRGAFGWTLFGLIWGIALLGIITKLVPRLRHSKLSLVLYLGMGWTIVLVIRPLYQHLPLNGLLWVIGGGLAYTIGVIFFVAKRKYSHLIWHLFTITGTTCHYFAILWYAV